MYDSLVSVGICTYSQKEMCANLVKQLIEYGPESIKIFVWDNNPSNIVSNFFHTSISNDNRITVIPDPNNSGYITSNNKMSSMSNSQYHIVSNDDVEVGQGWFDPFKLAFEENPSLAVVGCEPKFGYLDNDFHGQKVPPHGKLEYIEGWWMVFPREIINRYGLFDEANLKVATCEDSHLCLQLQEYGWKIKAIPNLPIKHFEHQTKDVVKNHSWGFENHEWCRKRWKKYLLSNRIFPRHKVTIPSNTSKEIVDKLKWTFPFTEIELKKV